MPWAATQQISTHWLRHTTLTWVERNFGYATARAYAGHADSGEAGTTATYVRAGVTDVAAALAALTGEPTHSPLRTDRASPLPARARGSGGQGPLATHHCRYLRKRFNVRQASYLGKCARLSGRISCRNDRSAQVRLARQACSKGTNRLPHPRFRPCLWPWSRDSRTNPGASLAAYADGLAQ
jgi:hypothetical protein